MSQPYAYPERVQQFLDRLRDLCGSHPDQRPPSVGARANLRRGASAATRHLAWPVVRQCGGDLRQPAWTAIGAAFAFYPQPKRERKPEYNLGATCNVLAARKPQEDKSSFDPRFRRLLAAESAHQLSERILPLVRLAKSKGVEVYYEELLWALLGWDAEDTTRREGIRIRWATSYWEADATGSDEWTDL